MGFIKYNFFANSIFGDLQKDRIPKVHSCGTFYFKFGKKDFEIENRIV